MKSGWLGWDRKLSDSGFSIVLWIIFESACVLSPTSCVNSVRTKNQRFPKKSDPQKKFHNALNTGLMESGTPKTAHNRAQKRRSAPW